MDVMNREERRAMKKRLAPIAKRVVFLERQIKQGINKEQCETEIEMIMNRLTLVEMVALEDYIASKNLLDIPK